MAMIGRKTLRSERARMQRIDAFFGYLSFVLLACYAVFVVVVWVSERESLRIDQVVIVGAHAVPEAELRVAAQRALETHLLFAIRRDNVLLFPTQRFLSEMRSSYPRIADINIDFSGSKELVVSLREYQPEFLYCIAGDMRVARAYKETLATIATSSAPLDGEDTLLISSENPENIVTPFFEPESSCYLADPSGYVFAHAPTFSGTPFLSLITIATGSPSVVEPIGTSLISSERLRSIMVFVSALRENGVFVSRVILLPEHDVEIHVSAPWDILWSTDVDPLESIRNLGIALDSISRTASDTTAHPRVIDLRFGNKVFYR
jgi:hypothetical protein